MKYINKISSLFMLIMILICIISACKKDPILIPAVPEDKCPFACMNGGTCIESTGNCDCPPEWTGAQCQFPVDPCGSVICLNDGVCINGQCDCPEGWTGPNCSTEDVVMTLISPSSVTLCPTQNSGSNADFRRDGPLVGIRVSLSVINSDEIYANVIFELEQTATGNPTMGYAERDVSIYTAPVGKRITEITGNLSCTTEYTDTDYFQDILEPDDCSIVDRFEVYGDTPGNDFGNCSIDEVARLTVHFDFIKIGLINKW